MLLMQLAFCSSARGPSGLMVTRRSWVRIPAGSWNFFRGFISHSLNQQTSCMLASFQALPCRESWAGPGDEANVWQPWIVFQHVLLVAYWFKHWTKDQKVQGSSPSSKDLVLFFWVHSALPQKMSRRFSFASFRRDVKPSVPETP